jgi:hypothetical protein
MGGERIPTGEHQNAVSRQLPLLCHKVSRTRRGFLSPVSSLSFLSLSLSTRGGFGCADLGCADWLIAN